MALNVKLATIEDKQVANLWGVAMYNMTGICQFRQDVASYAKWSNYMDGQLHRLYRI